MTQNLTEHDLASLKSLIQKAGWGEFASHIAAILLQQSQVPRQPQSTLLYRLSGNVSTLVGRFEQCGQRPASIKQQALHEEVADENT